MSCEDDADALDEAVVEAAQGPKRVKGDAGEYESHSLSDLVKAADRARAVCATRRRGGGPKYRKISPGYD